MLSKSFFVKFLALLVILSCSLGLKAQDVASLTGVVTDASGAVVPGVSVELLNTTTNAIYKATTNNVGSYTILNAPPGPSYKLTFSLSGFKSEVVTDLYLSAD